MGNARELKEFEKKLCKEKNEERKYMKLEIYERLSGGNNLEGNILILF